MADDTGRPDGTAPDNHPTAPLPVPPAPAVPSAPPAPPPPPYAPPAVPGYGPPDPYAAAPAGYGYAVPPPSYGYAAPTPPTSGKAITSLVLGIVGLVMMCGYGVGIIPAIVAVVFGTIARKEVRASGGAIGGEGMATAGLVVGWIGVGLGILASVLLVLLFVPAIVSSSSG